MSSESNIPFSSRSLNREFMEGELEQLGDRSGVVEAVVGVGGGGGSVGRND